MWKAPPDETPSMKQAKGKRSRLSAITAVLLGSILL